MENGVKADLDRMVRALQKKLGAANEATNSLKFTEAEKLYRECLKIAPRHVQVLWNLGVLVQRRADNPGERREAMEFYHDVIKESQGDLKTVSSAFTNMGVMMGKVNHIEEAEICFGMALKMNPENNAARINYADVLRHNGKYSEANKEFGEVLRLDPDSASAKFSLGMIALLFGDLKTGLELYEARFDVDIFPTKRFKSDKPEWKGEDLDGKTILIWEEQGFGDTFMMSRFFRELKRKWPTCKIWFRGNSLYRNIAKGMSGLDLFMSVESVPMSLYDYHCPIMSLPHRFGTTHDTIPNEVPYVIPCTSWAAYQMSEKVEIDRLDDKRIGLCWSGSPRHGKDHFRSIAPEAFQSLIDSHPHILFFSLQVGPRAHERERLKGIVDLAPSITDFTDTAQAIQQLDLVISVDTAVVHLTGALGKPCWMLCPFSPDWRWQLTGDTTPWYKEMRLFRQKTPGDWAHVLKRISDEL